MVYFCTISFFWEFLDEYRLNFIFFKFSTKKISILNFT